MHIEVITIFPELFDGFTSQSLLGKAIERGQLSLTFTNIRDFAKGPHQQVDDTPYGGGAGMVLKPEPLYEAVTAAKKRHPDARRICLSAQGSRYTQQKAEELSSLTNLILICGRYEGIDQRVIELVVDEEISLGDFVVMGGEVPAMAVIESTVRLLDGVMGNAQSKLHESFALGPEDRRLLEGPQYTRPPEFQGLRVPEVLLSGDHARIARWRYERSMEKSEKHRPDLLKKDIKA